MNDYINAEKFSHIKLPKLKGHVRIELKNEQTGKKDIVFEGDNMITNALSDIFSSNYCGALDYRKLLPLYSKMLGGILLFGNVQDVSSEGSADDYYIPDSSANTVIAHAGQTTFSSQADDITRGNPLDSAMHITDGAVTLAWTWGASAGNGTIKSVSLTHSDVGDAGTGSTSEAFKALKPIINANDNLVWSHSSGQNNNMVMFVGSDGYAYRFTTNRTTVTIYKTPLAYEQTGLVANTPFLELDQTESHNVITSTDFIYSPFFCYVRETHRLWLFYNTANSNSVKVEEINLSTWTSTNHDTDFSNLDEAVGSLNNESYPPLQLPYSNGFVYLRKANTGATSGDYYYSTGFLRVQLSSTANQKDFEGVINTLGGVISPTSTGKIIVGKQYVINNNSVFPCATDDRYVASTYNHTSAFAFMNQKNGLATIGGQYEYSGGNYYIAISKFYLGSKFNLPEPIVKANKQSMTVTYTLTEV